MGIMSKVLRQCRKPTGWLGRVVARAMNISHSEMTNWGLGHISIGKNDTILDIGCGGGGAIRKLARIAAEGRVHGIDYSEESVRISMKTNRRLIEAGRVEIQHGSVSSLPFPDDMFDLVTAIESHYFWPDLVNDMKEVLRVLKHGGMLLMMGGEYKGGKYDERNQQWVELADMAYHSVDEFDRLFCTAGCTEVQVLEDSDRGWMCGIGRKPQFFDEQDQDAEADEPIHAGLLGSLKEDAYPLREQFNTLVAGIVFHFLHDACLFLPQVPGGEYIGVIEDIVFYASLWLMVGIGCMLVKLSSDRSRHQN